MPELYFKKGGNHPNQVDGADTSNLLKVDTERNKAPRAEPVEIYIDQKSEEVAKSPPQKARSLVLEQKTSQNPLSALLVSPKDISFENQDKKEEILLLLRRHPISNLTWVILTIIFFVLPTFVLHPNFFQALFGVTFPQRFFTAISLLWYLFTFAFAFEKFLVWYFNVGIVTNERVLDIDFYGLLHKHITDASIAKIQDVSVKQGGVLAAFLNYGDVFVQTAAEVSSIEFLGVPRPAWVADFIGDLVEAQEEAH